jgi:uncharacterized protein YegL
MALRCFLGAAGMVSALALTTAADAQSTIRLQGGTDSGDVETTLSPRGAGGGVQITIQPRIDYGLETSLDFARITEMEEAVMLGLRVDPALVPTARVIEMVESIGMVDDAGIRIARGYDINVEHDLVVASSAGRVEITNIVDDEAGLVITALIRDDAGNVIDPPDGSLAVYTTGGERLCFTEEIINRREETRQSVIAPSGQARLPMSFVLLLDRSGSMDGHMDEVRRAAHGFLDALPENASCTVGAFSDGGGNYEVSEGFGAGRACRADAFSLSGLDRAGGGTNFYRPLGNVYRWLSEGGREDHQRLVIILTDGVANQELEREAAVRAAKGDIRTFVYHIGGQEERFLASIADHYLAHQGDLEASLDQYFTVLSESYTSQTVLRMDACEAPEE